MSLSIGIVGLPNVGKSTLFNALTDNNILAANYPFATIEPNTGIVGVPDPRLDVLARMYASQKVIPASVSFVDIAGLVAGASTGEGLGNQFLGHIRGCNAICQVVRAFTDPNVQHVDQEHNPRKDIDVINTELVLADLQTVEKRLPGIQKEARANPKLQPMAHELTEIKQILDGGTPLFAVETSKQPVRQAQDKQVVSEELRRELQLLTLKPMIYLFNVDEETLADEAKKRELGQLVAPAEAIFVCAKLESELQGLSEEESAELLGTYGVSESGLNQLIHAAYAALDLQSYLTAGEKEVRAWTIRRGATAPQAAGVIHGDFERGFIAAQVMDYNDLISAGSEAAAKAAGKVRTEGKTYIMQPNDIVEFRFNV